MMEKLEIGGGDQSQLRADLESKAILATGKKDAHGRAIIWMREENNVDARQSSPRNMSRLVATVFLHALRDTGVQKHGFVFLVDSSRAKLMDVMFFSKAFLGTVVPNMPMRVGCIFIINPPWVVSQIVYPVLATFISAKMRQSRVLIHGARKELWAARLACFDVPDSSLPIGLGGLDYVNCDACIESVAVWLLANTAPQDAVKQDKDMGVQSIN